MIFQFDRQQKRRSVEGWNCVCNGVEDRINLDAHEYNSIGYSFLINDMYDEAIESFKRSISLGSIESMRDLGTVYEKKGNLEDAYFWFLEASLSDDPLAINDLGRMYKKGIYVPKNNKRASQLWKLSKKLTCIK